jgi:hypothetical protein
MLTELSTYIINEILSYLDLHDLLSVLQVSKFFLQFCDIPQDLLKLYEPLCTSFQPKDVTYHKYAILYNPNSPEMILSLSKLKNLDTKTKLNISYATCYTDEQLIYISKTFPNLIMLDASGRYDEKITDLGLQAICERCPNLMYLSIRETHVTDEGLKYLTKLRKLVSLDLYETYAAKEKNLIGEIIDNNPNMVEIDYDDLFSSTYDEDRHKDYRQEVAYGHCSIKFNSSEEIASLLNKEYFRLKNILYTIQNIKR